MNEQQSSIHDQKNLAQNTHMEDKQPGEKAPTGGSILEQVQQQQVLESEHLKAVEAQAQKNQQENQKKQFETINNSLWGQLDNSIDFLKDNEKKAGYKEDKSEQEETEEFFKPPPVPKKVLTPDEIQKESSEKLKLFSEFVAAEAEASLPIVKKEKPKETPLRFKYYQNENESDVLTDIE